MLSFVIRSILIAILKLEIILSDMTYVLIHYSTIMMLIKYIYSLMIVDFADSVVIY